MNRWPVDMFNRFAGQSGVVGEMFQNLDHGHFQSRFHREKTRAILPNNPPLTQEDWDIFEGRKPKKETKELSP